MERGYSLVGRMFADSFILLILFGFNSNKLELINLLESIPTSWNKIRIESAKSACIRVPNFVFNIYQYSVLLTLFTLKG